MSLDRESFISVCSSYYFICVPIGPEVQYFLSVEHTIKMLILNDILRNTINDILDGESFLQIFGGTIHDITKVIL